MKGTKLNMLIEKTVENCEICSDERKQERKPRNATMRAVSFNEIMAIDLTEWWDETSQSKNVICHMIDEYSRLSVRAVIGDKKPETILNAIMSKWMCIYGTPSKILHDRGGEFVNAQTLNFMNVMGIKTKMTSVIRNDEFGNGVIERRIGVLKNTLNKIIKEYRTYENHETRPNMAISHASFAKNSLLDYNRYSPFMRVYGKQMDIVAGIEHESVTITDPWVARQMKEILPVKKAYLQSEADERLAASMRRRADPYHAPISIGTDVMYDRDGQKTQKGWHGPGKVIDREGFDYNIKHGKQLISAHARDVQKFLSQLTFQTEFGVSESVKNEKEKLLTRNQESWDEDELLINTKPQIKDNVSCEQCKRKTTCMRMLSRRAGKRQSNKTIRSVEQIANSLFERIFVCSDCISAYRRQVILDSFVNSGISDNQVGEIVEVMDRSPTQRVNFELMVTHEEVSKEVAKSFVVTTQQLGFQITGKQITRVQRSNTTGQSSHTQESSSENKSSEEDDPDSTDEDEDNADVSQDLSDLSNPSNLTIIDDVNELLAEGRRRREERRIKEERQAIDDQASSSQAQTSEDATDGRSVDEQEETMDTGADAVDQAFARPSRSRKTLERFGNAIPSNISKLFHVRGEDSLLNSRSERTRKDDRQRDAGQ